MKVVINKPELSKGIQVVQNVVSQRSTLPILSNILLETHKDSLKLTATDLDIGISCSVSAKIEEEGSITVPAKKFSDIIKEFPQDNLVISVKKNNVVTIEAQKLYFKIIGLPKDEFPKLPTFKDNDQIILDQGVLKNMLTMTAFAMSHDETRYVLNGIYLAIKGSVLRLVATDGRRLTMMEKKIDVPKNFEKRLIIPAKSIQELLRIIKDAGAIKILFSDTQAAFDLDDAVIISRLIEGEFPNYEQVVPKENKDKLIVNRDAFLLAVKRAGLLTTQDSLAIKIDLLKDRLIVSKSSPDVGESREELEAEYKGAEFSIGFNPGYIIDVLKNMPDEKVALEFTAPDKPAALRNENYMYVIMPMQLG